MRIVLSPDQMRALEKKTMRNRGIRSLELMERAAECIVGELTTRLKGAGGKTAVFACGPGMNGGDGYAAARLFACAGGQAIVLPLTSRDQLTGDAKENARAAADTPNVYFATTDRLAAMPRPDAWVDAMFGIGLTRAVNAEYRKVMDRMAADRAAGALILAVDVPSGIGASGQTAGQAVQADVTVTFEHPKLGHFLLDGLDAAGELAVHSIGLEKDLPADAARLAERSDLLSLFAPRRRNSYKNQYGHLLIIAGSRGMAGAALLTAKAALKSGAGLVTVACPKSIASILQSGAPCAMCVPLEEENGAIAETAVEAIACAAQNKTALAIGPGLSRDVAAGAVRLALTCGLPAIFDADALNKIAGSDELKSLLCGHHIITPHPGEAARLTGAPCEDAIHSVKALRELSAVALYKGAATVICGDKLTISVSGSPGMAKGGSGDVLTGVIGALLARGVEPERAAWAGSELHGLAGEAAARSLGETAMGAMDIVEHLSEVYRDLESEAAR